MKVGVYIDGLNLYYGGRSRFGPDGRDGGGSISGS